MRPSKTVSLFTVLIVCALFFVHHLWTNKNQIRAVEGKVDAREISTSIKKQEDSEADNPIISSTEDAVSTDIEFPLSTQIIFPGGGVANISFQLSAFYSVPRYRSGELDKFYGELLESVEQGNGSSASALAGLHEDCFGVPREASKHSELVEQFQISGSYELNGEGNESIQLLPGSREYDMAYDTIKKLYSFCKNVPLEDYKSRYELRQKALELGDPNSLINHAYALKETDPKAAFQVFKQIWDRGYITVGNEISFAYAAGNHSTTSDIPDYISAYAFQLATDRVFQEAANQFPDKFGYSQSPSRSGYPVNSNLTANQYLEAEEIAIRLLEKNDSCCKGLWK